MKVRPWLIVAVVAALVILRRQFGFSPEEVIVPPRNKRNNNPLNVRPLPNGQTWQGQVGVDDAKGGPFAVFSATWEGWRAACVTLLNYQRKHGLDTVRGIVTRWAPESDGNTPFLYAGRVAAELRLLPDQPFDVRAKLSDLALAMARVEGGAWPSFDPERDAGVRAALNYVK